MNFQVLGCSGSECDRNHPCSFLVGNTAIADMGSAASRLTVHQQSQITDIFLSHAHLDHTKDLAFFCENTFTTSKYPVRIRGSKKTLQSVKEHLLNELLWPDFSKLPNPKKPMIVYEPIPPRISIEASEMEILSIPVNHPGSCEAHFFSTSKGTVLYTGDTGPTEEVWEEVKKRKKKMKGILLEASFPDSMSDLAHLSGHLTPKLFEIEIQKMDKVDCPIFAYHLKAPYLDETRQELYDLGDSRVHLLEPGMKIEF
jgi:cAMP phosphodiesterase